MDHRTTQVIQDFMQYYDAVEVCANALWHDLAEIDPKEYKPPLGFTGIYEGELRFEWYETWRYGGFENHVKHIPVSWLWDRDEALQRVKDARDARDRRKQADEAAEALRQENEERALYLELKKKFGS